MKAPPVIRSMNYQECKIFVYSLRDGKHHLYSPIIVLREINVYKNGSTK